MCARSLLGFPRDQLVRSNGAVDVELPDRIEREEDLAAALFLLFNQQWFRLRRTRLRDDWGQFTSDTANVLANELTDTAVSGATMVANTFGVDLFALADVLGDARRYARTVASQLALHISDGLTNEIVTAGFGNVPLPDAAAKLRETIRQGLSEDRARKIAITETTRARTVGMRYASRYVRNVLGVQLALTWYTEDDEQVCKICRPLHKKRWDRYYDQFPLGPPAHVRCRCHEEFRIVDGPPLAVPADPISYVANASFLAT